ncbi:MAG: hypothetical protein H0T73_17650 [Ardenticatenales bacterium]|nr:hypothetical protein [Ardenticatenales bacterium]
MIPEDKRYPPLDRLRRAPTQISAPALVKALAWVAEIRALEVGRVDLSGVPVGRVKELARYAATAWSQTLARMPEERQIATLLAFAHSYEAIAQDDALDLLEQLTRSLLARAKREGQAERLRTLHDLDQAAWHLQLACSILLDPQYEDEEVRNMVFLRVPREVLKEAVARVEAGVLVSIPRGNNRQKRGSDP